VSFDVIIDEKNMIIKMKGFTKIWTLKSQISVPLKNIVGATFDPNANSLNKGIRFPGLHVPKLMTSGTYFHSGERHFWHVKTGTNTVVIRLKNEKYNQITIEVSKPQELVSKINSRN
jgi:hypothetical protein